MKIYDGHMHIGGSAAPDPEGLLNKLAACGISGGSVISIDPDDINFTYEQRITNLFDWTRGYEDRLFPVAWLHPNEEHILDKVRELDKAGVVAYKFIANNYHVYDELPQKVFRLIEELGKPIIFHCGILYDFMESSQFNKPLDWECFSRFNDLRFSIAHCGHPWYDEAMLVYGKFRWINWHTNCAAKGIPTIYYNNPWVTKHLHGDGTYSAPQLFLDTTPGPAGEYRKDLLKKMVSFCPEGANMFFGTDKYVEEYPSEFVANLLAFEKQILDDCGASDEFRENMYHNSLQKLLGISFT